MEVVQPDTRDEAWSCLYNQNIYELQVVTLAQESCVLFCFLDLSSLRKVLIQCFYSIIITVRLVGTCPLERKKNNENRYYIV